MALQYASEELRNNVEILKKAILTIHDNDLLTNILNKHTDNLEIVMAICNNNAQLICQSKQIMKNVELLKLIIPSITDQYVLKSIAMGNFYNKEIVRMIYGDSYVVIKDNDKPNSVYIDKKNFSVNDLMLVRATKFFPFNHTVSTAFKTKREKPSNVNLDQLGLGFADSNYFYRHTLHFSINGLVAGGFQGAGQLIQCLIM